MIVSRRGAPAAASAAGRAATRGSGLQLPRSGAARPLRARAPPAPPAPPFARSLSAPRPVCPSRRAPAAMAALAALLSEAAAAVQRCDGAALAALLAHDAPRPSAAVADALRTQPTLDIAALASQRLPAPYDEARGPPPQRRPAASAASLRGLQGRNPGACSAARSRARRAGVCLPLPVPGRAGAGQAAGRVRAPPATRSACAGASRARAPDGRCARHAATCRWCPA